MPNTLPTPNLQGANYPFSIMQALQALYAQGDVTLQLSVTFAQADASLLFTVPAGLRLSVGRSFWEVLTPFTGGASSAIGMSSTNAAYNTKGDLLGGAGGDVAAGLTAGFKGTIGAKAASQGVIVLVGGDSLRFDQIVSTFTAGAGIIHVPVALLPTS